MAVALDRTGLDGAGAESGPLYYMGLSTLTTAPDQLQLMCSSYFIAPVWRGVYALKRANYICIINIYVDMYACVCTFVTYT